MALLFLKLLLSNILHMIYFEIFCYLTMNLYIFSMQITNICLILRNNVWKAFECSSGAPTNWLNSKDVVLMLSLFNVDSQKIPLLSQKFGALSPLYSTDHRD